MSIGYSLINRTKKERLLFSHLNASTALELTGDSIASSVITWYLLKNSGDNIGFIPDHYNKGDQEWPYADLSRDDIKEYPDVTDLIVDELIEKGVLKDLGKDIFDDDEPEIYIRKLENIWET